jgi:subfamily B ATP-binding cassette protein MsbA
MPQAVFLAIMAGFFIMYEPLKRMGRLHLQLQKIAAVSESVFDVLDREKPRQDRPEAVEFDGLASEIRFERVSLSYGPHRAALREVSFAIPRGTVCALVGPSGAGKSSIANLLLRFYEPTGGSITIDGRDITELKTRSLRARIGVVTQETLLFADTVAENIGYGKPGATREEVVEAARKANAHDFIMDMPEQYDTVLSERGQNLSGGQCQRLAIARAILKNPEILILDEATSSLDAESEMAVQQAMTELMRGRTVVVIAHRLASLRGADQLIVLDEGRIVEAGAHAELLGRDGLYRRLHDLQAL